MQGRKLNRSGAVKPCAQTQLEWDEGKMSIIIKINTI